VKNLNLTLALGNVAGVFSAAQGPNGQPISKLVDSNGRDIWEVGAGPRIHEVK